MRLASQVRHDDERKLQPLGLVDGHQPHDVLDSGSTGGGGLFRLVGDELRQLIDEIRQREDARLIKRPGLIDQFAQVGQLPLAEEFCQQQRVIAGGRALANQARDRQTILQLLQSCERVAANVTFRRSASVSCGGRIARAKAPPPDRRVLCKPEERFVGQREEGAPQHAGQADQVARAIQKPQQVQQVEDFLLAIKRASSDQVVRNVIASQRLLVMLDVD